MMALRFRVNTTSGSMMTTGSVTLFDVLVKAGLSGSNAI